mmetsp:Transcript_107809/g.315182  ORF Transcript_107809/g.315182 Transcript_107809/m.315182 type:complete len:322 (+) Transcript_107809:48-1013(+)
MAGLDPTCCLFACLHRGLLCRLSKAAGPRQGATQGARLLKSTLGPKLFRRIRESDIAYHFAMHITEEKINEFFQEIDLALAEVSTEVASATGPSSSSDGGAEMSPGVEVLPTFNEYFNVALEDMASQTDDSIPPLDASCLTMTADPTSLIELAVFDSLRALQRCTQAAIEECTALLDSPEAFVFQLEAPGPCTAEPGPFCGSWHMDFLDRKRDQLRDQADDFLCAVCSELLHAYYDTFDECVDSRRQCVCFPVICHPAMQRFLMPIIRDDLRLRRGDQDGSRSQIDGSDLPGGAWQSIYNRFRCRAPPKRRRRPMLFPSRE